MKKLLNNYIDFSHCSVRHVSKINDVEMVYTGPDGGEPTVLFQLDGAVIGCNPKDEKSVDLALERVTVLFELFILVHNDALAAGEEIGIRHVQHKIEEVLA